MMYFEDIVEVGFVDGDIVDFVFEWMGFDGWFEECWVREFCIVVYDML